MARYQDSDSRKPGVPYSTKAEKHPVADPGPEHCSLSADWALIHDVIGGTPAMRAAKRTYLKQHPYESDPAYDDRLSSAVLDNYTRRTLETLVGKAFREPPQPGEDVPETILPLMEDVDCGGTGLHSFARDWFRGGVRDKVAYVLVDHTQAVPREDGAPRTKADDAKDGVRPFWRLIYGPEMLDVHEAIVGGRTVTTMCRFRDDEQRISADGFTQSTVARIRVVRPATWELWELKDSGRKKEWVQVEAGANDLGEVALVRFATTKDARPPLADLADKNVEHWVSSADQRNILTVARFPMLAASGVQTGENQGGAGEIVVGPRKFLTTSDPQSKVYFVEHTGAAIESGTTDLERLEERMASYGAEFLTKKPGGETATGRALDGAEAISPLQGWGLDFKDCLEKALQFTARWLGLGGDEGGSIEFEVTQDVDVNEPAELTALDNARTRGDISRVAWVEEMKVRGVLREEYDADEDRDEIDAEPPPPGTGLDGMVGAAPAKKAKPPAKAPPTK